MTRIALTDGSGRWFDGEAAELFAEDTRFDGHNHISLATGSQWDHQRLYRTASDIWVLHCSSQYQHVADSYEEITDDQAAVWLVENDSDHPDAAEKIASLEI